MYFMGQPLVRDHELVHKLNNNTLKHLILFSKLMPNNYRTNILSEIGFNTKIIFL